MPDEKKLAAECRRRAAEAQLMARAGSALSEKRDLLEVERRWLRLARSHECQIASNSDPFRFQFRPPTERVDLST